MSQLNLELLQLLCGLRLAICTSAARAFLTAGPDFSQIPGECAYPVGCSFAISAQQHSEAQAGPVNLWTQSAAAGSEETYYDRAAQMRAELEAKYQARSQAS